jgi:hypothetical protein
LGIANRTGSVRALQRGFVFRTSDAKSAAAEAGFSTSLSSRAYGIMRQEPPVP